MPQRFSFSNENMVREYLEQTYSAIINKDVIKGRTKTDREKFTKLSSYIMAYAGKEFSSVSVERYFKNNNGDTFDRKKIYRYLEAMEKACLIDRV